MDASAGASGAASADAAAVLPDAVDPDAPDSVEPDPDAVEPADPEGVDPDDPEVGDPDDPDIVEPEDPDDPAAVDPVPLPVLWAGEPPPPHAASRPMAPRAKTGDSGRTLEDLQLTMRTLDLCEEAPEQARPAALRAINSSTAQLAHDRERRPHTRRRLVRDATSRKPAGRVRGMRAPEARSPRALVAQDGPSTGPDFAGLRWAGFLLRVIQR